MSIDVHPRTGPDNEPVDALDLPLGSGTDSPRARSRRSGGLGSLFDGLWRFFISMRTGLWLILGLGIATLAGTLVEQADPSVVADEASYSAFLEAMRSRYGGWTDVLSAAGMFHVFSTWWFRGLTLLLCTSILACSINRAPRLWKVAMHPRLHMGETFFTHAPLRDALVVGTEPETATAEIGEVLERHHFRVVRDDTQGGPDLYADRFRFGPFGTVVAHVSFVLLVLGFVTTASTGFREEAFVVPVGTTVAVGHDTGLSVEARSFTDAYYPSGEPKDYASDLVLHRGDEVVARQEIRVNDPLRYDGIWFHQASFGVAVSMRVTDETGAVLFDAGVPLAFQTSDGLHSVGSFDLPDQDLTVFTVTAASGQVDPTIKAGQVQLEVHRQGVDAPVTVEVLSQGGSTTLDGLTYTFDRTRTYTQLIVRRDPGAALVWVGAGLLVAGLFLVFFFPHRRIWLRIRPAGDGTSRVTCASTMKRDTAFEPQFHQIMTDIQLAGTPSGGPVPTTK